MIHETTQLTDDDLLKVTAGKGSSGSSDPTDLTGGVEMNAETDSGLSFNEQRAA